MGADAAAVRPHPASDGPPPRWRFLRPKGHIGPETLALLAVIGAAPLLTMLARVAAFPGSPALPIPGYELLREFGRVLNQALSLAWVPTDDRAAIIYLLLLPTGALLIAVARLTFGLRVLGLRAILISIGFQEAGVLPSLVLIAVVVCAVVVVRPSLRRMRLPLYARLTLILSLAALIMVGALLLGPMLRSESIWNVAFFPVLILAMLAEGIAKTLVNDSAVSAAWRTFWTIFLAGLLAVIGQSTAFAGFVLQFPEVLLTQIVAIVFLSEFFDLRLLEAWPDRLARLLAGVRPWYPDRFPIAVVRNRWNTGIIGRLGRAAPRRHRKRSVQRGVDALRGLGFSVRVFEADMSLLRELGDFMPPDPRTDLPGGIVFNFATGTQGRGRLCQVPAMLELAGIAYTGPDPVAQARLADRYVLLSLLRQADVDVPAFVLAESAADAKALEMPLSVRPRCEPDEPGATVRDRESLAETVRRLRREYRQDVVIEEIAAGRDYRVSLIGNRILECLPLLEYLPDGRKVCPAPVDDVLAERIRDHACRAYKAAGCRDFARVDLRLGRSGTLRVQDIRCSYLFARRGAFVRSAEAGGYDFPGLLLRILGETARRYDDSAGRTFERAGSGEQAVVPLAPRRAATK